MYIFSLTLAHQTGSHYATRANVKLRILLPEHPKCWELQLWERSPTTGLASLVIEFQREQGGRSRKLFLLGREVAVIAGRKFSLLTINLCFTLFFFLPQEAKGDFSR